MKITAPSLILLIALGGCQSYQTTLNAKGPVQERTDGQSSINTFRAAFALAAKTVPGYNQDGNPVLIQQDAGNPDATNLAYLNAGFNLSDANCLDYFQRAGNLQQAANVFKDISTAFLPVAAGALALSANSARAAAILSLVGASNTAALNTVFSDFLFDASNIDDVQQLTMKALATHEAQVRDNVDNARGRIEFGWTTQQIMQHQAICQPAHILLLVRQAIANGKVIAENTGQLDRNQQAPTSGATAPRPPPSMVEVRVVPAISALVPQKPPISPPNPPPRPTVSYKAAVDGNVAVLTHCIWPKATRVDTSLGLVAVDGSPATPDPKVADPLVAWLKAKGVQLGVFLSKPDYAPLRTEAVAKFCTPS